MNSEKRNFWFDAAAIIVLFVILYLFKNYGSEYQIRILNNMGIFITLAVSYNLVNGFCGVLHLGPNAFVAIGAYVSALLTMTPAEKQLNFIIQPLIWPLNVVQIPFVFSLLAAGAMATVFAYLISFPVFRVRGDYLAIVTLDLARL